MCKVENHSFCNICWSRETYFKFKCSLMINIYHELKSIWNCVNFLLESLWIGKRCELCGSFLARVRESQGTWVPKSQGKSGNFAKKIGWKCCIGQNSGGGISISGFLVKSLLNKNCHNCRTSNGIGMTFGSVTILDQRNTTTSKKFDDDIVKLQRHRHLSNW